MPLNIPFIFKAGTKAKANEVNSNFQSVVQFGNQVEAAAAQNELDIQVLQDDKAEKNGDINERFQVADAVTDRDAVNKQTLRELTSNSIETIRGLRLSKGGTQQIIATPGACYDSTLQYMITSNATLTLSTAGVGASTTQYVYICGATEASGLQPVLVLSTSTTSATLPAGYDYYRYLGSVVINAQGTIEAIGNVGDQYIPVTVGFIGPAISGALKNSVTYGSGENHWVYLYAGYVEKHNVHITMTVDGLLVANLQSGWKHDATSSTLIPVKKGQTVVITMSRDNGVSYWQQFRMI